MPNKLITSAEIAAHFYVLLEVLEEEEKLNIYGFGVMMNYLNILNILNH
ncbi:MAG: hypothetical protein HC787_08590 [Nostocaceae cyanobacterium CSU_2_110]|nr:hypothetical protein [Nostocaceae cyanobacterium CSU_2_110]